MCSAFYTMHILTQQTASKAVVEMQKNQGLGDSFKLLLGLAEIHVPRMWVERMTDDADNQVGTQLYSSFIFYQQCLRVLLLLARFESVGRVRELRQEVSTLLR